jgi:spore photoproduct lyase
MIIYREKKLHDNKIAQSILEFYKHAKILDIDNYKNIFDKNIAGNTEKSLIIASVWNALLEAPKWYGFEWQGYFLKNSLNCIYDCSYCYLKWAFKNDIPVFFVNYDDMKKQIYHLLSHKWEKTWFYSSDYSDNLATTSFTQFVDNFVPFFETMPNAMMEIRTKSTNIQLLLQYKNIQNTEIAFSLNPQEIISKYEKRTPNLDMRIQAINTLLEAGWKVWIRFLPLLEVENYQNIYTQFLEYIIWKIDMQKVHSVFIGGLMYTYEDYQKILRKEPNLDLLYRLKRDKDGFVREKKEVREYFYQLFGDMLGKEKCNICLDN